MGRKQKYIEMFRSFMEPFNFLKHLAYFLWTWCITTKFNTFSHYRD